ncbi:MAG: pectinacetylesterase family protein [Casimicrobiaceae bacterium]|nr:pectinacetylesterase family protein [Casimicrobiaceae bacterium]MCX8098043.1 pectinacetylesterase family protein [Casimicrobiaceae bacterium]MDW8312429.1 pectin acetylesterase-family hydrolase [Burkholderiales bacterium]
MPQINSFRKSFWRGNFFLAWVSVLVLAGCGSDETRVPVAPALAPEPGGFVRVTPTAAEIDGRTVQPTCSGVAGTDRSFHFWARRGSVNRLVIFFEGGGACWDGATCSLPWTRNTGANDNALFKAEILPIDNPTLKNGIFNLRDPRNPVRDWSFVYIPYCTGDVHAGSNTASYTNPFTRQNFAIEHRGHDNFRVVLRWIEDNFAGPEHILVTGSSAGGYGAIINYPWIRRAFPYSQAIMLADAAQGVVTAEFDALRNANWNIQLAPFVYGSSPQATATGDILPRLASTYPQDRFAQYTTSLDTVQMLFYDVMLHGLAGQQGTACQAWIDRMLAGLRRNQQAVNFVSYLAAGTSHTILGSGGETPLFFSEQSAGVPFHQWFTNLLSPAGVRSVACTDCTTFPGTCPF